MVVLWIIVVFLICVAGLLAIPLEVAFSIKYDEAFQSRVSLCWLFGLVRTQALSDRIKKIKVEPQKPKKKKGKSKGRHGGARYVFVMVKSKGFIRRLLKLVNDVIRTMHLRKLNIDARLGLGDPADTGRLWGVIGPVAGLMANCSKANVRIEPDFYDESFYLGGEGQMGLIPLQLIFTFITFLISPAMLRAVMAVIISGRK
ncbi:MAG: DUF2953 domain-containing protein [Proteobacteria bacterium]|nr:DUF2953 domain-containing protein [Pseudomonadota bacterium]